MQAAQIVRRMRLGILARRRQEEERLRAANVSIYAPGIQIPSPPYPYPPSPEEPARKKDAIEGIEITTTVPLTGKPLKLDDEDSLMTVNFSYPMIPTSPKAGEPVAAYVNVRWTGGQLQYLVWEPPLTPEDRRNIDLIKRDLEERLDIDFSRLGEIKAKLVLREEIQKSCSVIPDITPEKRATLAYYMERDFLGLGKINILMLDPSIEDISCDGIGIPIYIFHRDPKFGSLKTNIVFDTADELNSFVEVIAQRSNKSISIAEPLLDAALPDGSRVQATLGTDIARKGSNFTIRKFTEKPLTPTHMMKYHTLDAIQLAYLWMAVENGKSILVSGGTATGKTSLLNALSLFIRPALKVVSIEDTPELRLPLPHWIPHVARSPLAIKGKIGEVTLFDLLKTSLRQRPDYIIVGEVRGEEAFVLFQQMATGHSSLATIHAASFPQLIDRLITPPISLPPSLIENIDIIVFLTLSRLRNSYVRRADNIMEVTGIEKDRPETVKVFEWKPITDAFEIREKSVVLRKIAFRLGLTEDTVKEELVRRKQILDWMLEKEIYDYREVAGIISLYYADPDRVMAMMQEH
ncbi:MAG: type II/IV secretion system ATPase subunit [Candidatus Aenigmarchaeota archaeon]|nr:type II/IV secretion system ATPase subunit [Candidatus Aenigmarchaeota archaeon]